jgi:hypothetical protein
MRAESYVGQDFGELSRVAVVVLVLECDVASKMWTGTNGLLARRGLSELVPEGLSDRRQAIYCLGSAQRATRPVGTV